MVTTQPVGHAAAHPEGPGRFAVLEAPLRLGPFDQDRPIRIGRGSEEVPAIAPSAMKLFLVCSQTIDRGRETVYDPVGTAPGAID